ncbi:acyltransferase [Pedobacter aquae]|uniref:Acyltransferase n=1 Tax=Pedobacter aquae TaxID=2605747 RepID=A0A5C0VFD6_9SPHI|nr:acyltransferase [Pedobacter aquae]QEK51226.1 acyltransferase [Pedobacter aquae]
MSVLERIKSDPFLKKIALWLLIPRNRYSPRLWVKLFLNPFKHHKGKGTIIRRRSRLDVFPFKAFNVGKNALIEDFTVINNAVGDVNIGNDVVVGLSNVIIGPVNIGNNTIIAQHVVISALNHQYEDIHVAPKNQKILTKLVDIGDDAWIGANCVITAGVKIGKHCIIGAGSVVTKNIDDYSVAVGNPAVVVKRYNWETKSWEKVV